MSPVSALTQDESCLSFTGCLDLEALVLSSPHITPDVFRELACRVPSVKALKLSGCFDRRFLSQHVRPFPILSWKGGMERRRATSDRTWVAHSFDVDVL